MERDDKDMLEVTREQRGWLHRILSATDPHFPAWLALVAFFLLIFIALFSLNAFAPGGIGDDIYSALTGGSGSGGASGGTAGGSGAADEAQQAAAGPLAGTWRVYQDDSKSMPLVDLDFDPGGKVTPRLSGPIPWWVADWTYTEEAGRVEIDLTCNATANDGGTAVWHVWFHLRREGDEMRGTCEAQKYHYQGIEKGTTYLGKETEAEAAYACPIAPGE